jgi:hypothetical protein
MARLAQATPVLRVVGVEALLDEVSPAERVMVGVDAGPLATQDASRMLGKDTRPEPLLVLLPVPSLPCRAALLLCLCSASIAPPALAELGAAGLRADSPACASGHGAPPPVPCVPHSEGGS